MPNSVRYVAMAALGLIVAVPSPAAADIDHEQAYQLLKEGRIRPLIEIIKEVSARFPGEVLEVELELEDGRYVYEVKILGPQGRVQEIEVDAKTGEVLKVEDDD
jgi:uncharacterized membrane protein YkoI